MQSRNGLDEGLLGFAKKCVQGYNQEASCTTSLTFGSTHLFVKAYTGLTHSSPPQQKTGHRMRQDCRNESLTWPSLACPTKTVFCTLSWPRTNMWLKSRNSGNEVPTQAFVFNFFPTQHLSLAFGKKSAAEALPLLASCRWPPPPAPPPPGPSP